MTDLATLETAAALLRPLWESISPEYKSKYRREIWEQFQSRVTAQARMTNRLSVLLSRLSLTFDNTVIALYAPEQRAWLESQLRAPQAQQDAILRVCREQAPVIILLLRNLIQDERDARAEGSL